MDVVRYPTGEFPWPRLVSAALEFPEDCLDSLMTERTAPAIREDDQATRYHRRFYRQWSGYPRGTVLQGNYQRFIEQVAAPYAKRTGIKGPFAYQAIPTFRICEPGNVAVGEWHNDGKYGHPDGEINFWVPLTPAFDTNSLWVANYAEGIRVLRDTEVPAVGHMILVGNKMTYVEPVTLKPGEMFVFDAVNTYHGNMLNDTGKTRVSIDFRLIPTSKLPKEPKRSVNTGTPFALGGYYARRVVI